MCQLLMGFMLPQVTDVPHVASQETIVSITSSFMDSCSRQDARLDTLPLLTLPQYPTASEIALTGFPSINPLAAARLISLGCSLSELLGLNEEEQRQLAMKLSDIPTISLELFFKQATYGQPITGQLMAVGCSHMNSLAQPENIDGHATMPHVADSKSLDEQQCKQQFPPPNGYQHHPCTGQNSMQDMSQDDCTYAAAYMPYSVSAGHSANMDVVDAHYTVAPSFTVPIEDGADTNCNDDDALQHWQQPRHCSASCLPITHAAASPRMHSRHVDSMAGFAGASAARQPLHKPKTASNPFSSFACQPQPQPQSAFGAPHAQQQSQWQPQQQLRQQQEQQSDWHAQHQSRQQQKQKQHLQWQAHQQQQHSPQHTQAAMNLPTYTGADAILSEMGFCGGDFVDMEEVEDAEQHGSMWDQHAPATAPAHTSRSLMHLQRQHHQQRQQQQQHQQHQQQPTDWHQFLPTDEQEDEAMPVQSSYMAAVGGYQTLSMFSSHAH